MVKNLGVCNSLLMDLGQQKQEHSAVYTGEFAQEGSVAVAVGISNM